MALFTCPQCEKEGFYWSIDEDNHRITRWHCHACRYEATEDESQESECPQCGERRWMLLSDPRETYRYCDRCRRKWAV